MNQRGFTTIELLAGVAVIGMIMSTVVPAFHQMTQNSSRINGRAAAISDLEGVARSLSRDMGQAQLIDLVDGAPPVSQMTLTWKDLTTWATLVSHSASYVYSGTRLQLTYDSQVTYVGRSLTDVQFSLSGNLVTVTVTSTPDPFLPQTSVTRTYIFALSPPPI